MLTPLTPTTFFTIFDNGTQCKEYTKFGDTAPFTMSASGNRVQMSKGKCSK